MALTGLNVVAVDLDAKEVLAQLPANDLSAPLELPFLTWLREQLQAEPDTLDLVLAAEGLGDPPGDLIELEGKELDHPRVRRAQRHRRELRYHTDSERRGLLIIGRGLAGRFEVGVEVEPAHRGKGLGKTLFHTARRLLPKGEPIFAQVATGNAASIRALLAVGFKPIGSEVLFLRSGE